MKKILLVSSTILVAIAGICTFYTLHGNNKIFISDVHGYQFKYPSFLQAYEAVPPFMHGKPHVTVEKTGVGESLILTDVDFNKNFNPNVNPAFRITYDMTDVSLATHLQNLPLKQVFDRIFRFNRTDEKGNALQRNFLEEKRNGIEILRYEVYAGNNKWLSEAFFRSQGQFFWIESSLLDAKIFNSIVNSLQAKA